MRLTFLVFGSVDSLVSARCFVNHLVGTKGRRVGEFSFHGQVPLHSSCYCWGALLSRVFSPPFFFSHKILTSTSAIQRQHNPVVF